MAMMQFKDRSPAHRKTAVVTLLAVASVITLLGLGFGIYSVISGVTFPVMSANIPGVLFAAVVTFLGIRYLLATLKLAKKIRNEQFAWGNFKRQASKGDF